MAKKPSPRPRRVPHHATLPPEAEGLTRRARADPLLSSTNAEQTGRHPRLARVLDEPTPQEVRGIRIVRPDGEATELRLAPDRSQILIGRRDGVDVRIDSDRVSRLHGLLRFVDDVWWYEDMGSTNGSMVVDKSDVAALQDAESTQEIAARIVLPRERVPLQVGDVIILGSRHATLEPLADAPVPDHVVLDDTRLSDAAKRFELDLKRASTTHLPVFLLGPSGAGKTTAARAIHDEGLVHGRFVPLNCARLPRDDGHLHSTLLGHVKGGFTGAIGAREGLFVHARDGTLFLDEVESLPDVAQGFLLDVLEGSGMLHPFGAPPGAPPLDLRMRLISASKVPLHATSLRKDLAQRLTEGHVVRVPSLRERREDIPGLARVILDELAVLQHARFSLSKDAVRFLVDATWEGEIRALRAVLNTAAMNARSADERRGAQPDIVLRRKELAEVYAARADAFGEAPARAAVVDEGRASAPVEAAASKNPRHLTASDVRRALEASDGNLTHAAHALGVARNTLVSKMRTFGLR